MARSDGGRARLRDAAIVAGLALAARLGMVVWAWSRVPPAADGTFYDVIARRIAAGLGYTWLWPDGSVTFAAHYPVGYPAFMALGYRLFGANPGVAMLENAAVGAVLPVAVHAMVARVATARVAMSAGVVAALHPALVSYTPALMTEGVTSALVASAMALSAAALSPGATRPRFGLVLAGLVVGLATYFRPQCIVFAPVFAVSAMIATRAGLVRTLASAALLSVAALVVVAPWTARNCRVMDRCALVSVNGGWNLLIGTDRGANGTWAELQVPEACRDVFDEAGKDACFGLEARRVIAADPWAWVALAPRKLSATFDFFGAGPGYLRSAAPEHFSERAKRTWLWGETLVQRVLVAAGLLGLVWRLGRGAPPRAKQALSLAALVLAALPHAAPAYLVLGALAWVAPRWVRGLSPSIPMAGAVVLVTALVHAVFFGAGRYGLVVVAPTVVLASLVFTRRSGGSTGAGVAAPQGF